MRNYGHRLLGKRVELIHCADRYTRLKPGSVGTVRFVDDRGTVHVDWDPILGEDGKVIQSSSSLGMCEDAGDRYMVIS